MKRKPLHLVPDARLETFVSGKYGWQTLLPDEVRSLAIEAMRNRHLIKRLGETLGELHEQGLLPSVPNAYTDNHRGK